MEKRCNICGRKAKNLNPDGAGKICSRKLIFANVTRDTKSPVVRLIGNYPDSRTYIVFTDPRHRVKIQLEPGDVRVANCDCGSLDRCDHIAAVAVMDRQNFISQGK